MEILEHLVLSWECLWSVMIRFFERLRKRRNFSCGDGEGKMENM